MRENTEATPDLAATIMQGVNADAAPATTPAQPELFTGQQPAQQPAPAQAPAETDDSLRAHLKGLGYDVSQFADDNQAVQALLHQSNEYRRLAPCAGEWLQYREDFLRWKESQGRPTATPEQPKGWWSPPATMDELNTLVQQYYVRDANGNIVPSQTTPPDVIKRVTDAQAFYNKFQDQWRSNPNEVLDKWWEGKRNENIHLFQQEFAARQSQADMRNIVNQNAGWMLAKGENKLPIVSQGPNGLQYEYTPLGMAYWYNWQYFQSLGHTDVNQLNSLALQMTEGQYAIEINKQREAATQQQNPSSTTTHAGMNRIANAINQFGGNGAPSVPIAPDGDVDLSAMIDQSMRANGVF